ncbi:MAG: sodium:proton antiporter [Desulfovibrionales bacterium]
MNESFSLTPFLIYGTTAIILFCMGLHGVIVRRNVLRIIMGLNVMAAGVFLLFISVADRNRETFADPVPQAMVLTGIVISISATAFALALARRIHSRTGQTTLLEPSGPEEDD